MALIVFARFHFNRQCVAVLLDDEVQFALLFAVELVELKAVGLQFLSHHILVNRAIVDALLIVDDA